MIAAFALVTAVAFALRLSLFVSVGVVAIVAVWSAAGGVLSLGHILASTFVVAGAAMVVWGLMP